MGANCKPSVQGYPFHYASLRPPVSPVARNATRARSMDHDDAQRGRDGPMICPPAATGPHSVYTVLHSDLLRRIVRGLRSPEQTALTSSWPVGKERASSPRTMPSSLKLLSSATLVFVSLTLGGCISNAEGPTPDDFAAQNNSAAAAKANGDSDHADSVPANCPDEACPATADETHTLVTAEAVTVDPARVPLTAQK